MTSNRDPKQSPRTTAGETWLMIFGLGGIIAFGVTILQPLLDWSRGNLKPLFSYLQLVFIVCLPFLIGFVICICLIRRNRK